MQNREQAGTLGPVGIRRLLRDWITLLQEAACSGDQFSLGCHGTSFPPIVLDPRCLVLRPFHAVWLS